MREEVLVKAKKLYPDRWRSLPTASIIFKRILKPAWSAKKSACCSKWIARRRLSTLRPWKRNIASDGLEIEELSGPLYARMSRPCFPRGNSTGYSKSPGRVIKIRGASRGLFSRRRKCDSSPFLKGPSNPAERTQIEAHVVHSFNFLLQIPWTREIREIPRIARAHHEKLNGTGYPYKLQGDEIPVQAKIMTICDIFDALSASDRPYKRAVPPERALDILEMSVKDQELDPELYRLFLEAKIFQLANKV